MPEPKNLVFFLTDNHSRGLVGAAGHPVVQTPALDRIAGRGVRFANAYCVSPLCCPSRAVLATGRYPHQTGYWDNALAYDGKVPGWQHRVRDQGCTTAAIGKLHYRSPDDDNGFCEEIATMHIVDGKGALATLLRATQDGVPRRQSHKALYQDSVVGEADYQGYDRVVTARTLQWLKDHRDDEKPWVLLVSFASPHPPFKVPQRFWDMYPLDAMPMPAQWRLEDRPRHPALEYLAWMNSIEEEFDETFVRRIIAGYCGLITHTDEQVGMVLDALDTLGLSDDTRILYTSDHGEAAGHHGILGKANHYEHSIGVPLLMAGLDIPAGKVVEQCASHVDLFPTIVEAVGADLADSDAGLPGISLWPAIGGEERPRHIFAEYHAMGSRNSGFAYREGDLKLIYHVDMPDQLFNLAADPFEEHDLLAGGADHPAAAALERKLREVVDPEEIDARSKADQFAHMERFGGLEEVRRAGIFSMSPVPGQSVRIEKT